jgi:hypothetical protein
MEEVEELIRRYDLQEDLEHVIVPVTGKNGHVKRIFLLKRRFVRVMYPEEQFVDYPLAEVIEATVRYPEHLLSEALYLIHKEADASGEGLPDEDKVAAEGDKTVYEAGNTIERNEK